MEALEEAVMKERAAPENGKKSTVIITYNSVRNHPAGVYGDGDLVVYSDSNSSSHYQNAPEALSRVLHSIHGRLNPEDIEKVYVYAGLYALQGALDVASQFAETGKLSLVACGCDSYQKTKFGEKQVFR